MVKRVVYINKKRGVVMQGNRGDKTTYKYVKKIWYTLDKYRLFNSIFKNFFFVY